MSKCPRPSDGREFVDSFDFRTGRRFRYAGGLSFGLGGLRLTDGTLGMDTSARINSLMTDRAACPGGGWRVNVLWVHRVLLARCEEHQRLAPGGVARAS